MVRTSAGPELARVSLIAYAGDDDDDDDEKSSVVFDELVKPRRRVLDYLTGEEMNRFNKQLPSLYRAKRLRFQRRLTKLLSNYTKPPSVCLPSTFLEYSGITPKMLERVDTRIEHIQVLLLSTVDEDDILVGHSLENDLRALRVAHANVVDTSVVFRDRTNGRKLGLRQR